MDTVLGLAALAVYIVFVVALASAVTLLVIKISPAQSARQKPKPEA
jgi:hypothetical protein